MSSEMSSEIDNATKGIEPDFDNKICHLYIQGSSSAAIARYLRCTDSFVLKVLKAHNVFMRSRTESIKAAIATRKERMMLANSETPALRHEPV